MIKELDSIVLLNNMPEYGLCAGDLGTVVLVHGNEGYEVEFLALDGETLAVTSLRADQVREVQRREVAHARLVAAI